ncbi:hypothetical protein [Streptomyces regalis]|uniref:Uncharacterized protein n=1 Tax=Streptomyces regalis TaxID=68262 RepID=A0A101JSC8_9ACTN|nr:hypothetical protein [Streptomyces regalis]KUL32174.1 hypothetical protein ADL12_23590 [Streptomyces regalis]
MDLPAPQRNGTPLPGPHHPHQHRQHHPQPADPAPTRTTRSPRRPRHHTLRRLILALTARTITQYLFYRHRRWPHTINPHLIVNEHTAQNEKPVSPHRLGDQFRETGVTLNQIRMDRQLEEALTHGPDALHLAAVFGISERAAMRYAATDAARAFLATPLEQ